MYIRNYTNLYKDSISFFFKMSITLKDLQEIEKKIEAKEKEKEIRKQYNKLKFRYKHPIISKIFGMRQQNDMFK